MYESVLSSFVFINQKCSNHLMVINSKMDEKYVHTMECYSAMKISEPELSVSLWLYLTHNSERKQRVTEKYLHHDIIYTKLGNMQNNAISVCCLAINTYVVEIHGNEKHQFNRGVTSGGVREGCRGGAHAGSMVSVIFYSLRWVVGRWMFGYLFLSIFSLIQNVRKFFSKLE